MNGQLGQEQWQDARVSRKGKVAVTVFSVVVIVFMAPILYSAIGAHGYFEGYRCACGFQNYYFIDKSALWTFSPGHGRVDRLFTLREHDGMWDARKDGGELVLQLRLAKGALLEKSPNRTEWQSHPRIYIIWGVWIERLLAKKDDVGDPMPMHVPLNRK